MVTGLSQCGPLRTAVGASGVGSGDAGVSVSPSVASAASSRSWRVDVDAASVVLRDGGERLQDPSGRWGQTVAIRSNRRLRVVGQTALPNCASGPPSQGDPCTPGAVEPACPTPGT